MHINRRNFFIRGATAAILHNLTSEGNEKKIKDICSPGQHLTDTGQENKKKPRIFFFVIYRERYTR